MSEAVLEKVIRYGQRQNAKEWPSGFISRFLEPGLISYEDLGGDKELLEQETIAAHAQSFVGKPVVIKHSNVNPGNMLGKAVGYISRVWHEPSDGWHYCEGVIHDDAAKELIRKGHTVSCGYHVTSQDDRPGVYHCIDYARKLLAFEGEHLAIVANPRYEGATIRLNSKSNNMSMFKLLFGKKKEPGARENEAAPVEITDETPVEIDGKTVRMNELVSAYKASKGELSGDSVIALPDGSSATISELVTSRANEKKMCAEADKEKETKEAARKNAEEAEAKEKEKKENEAKEEEEKKKKENSRASGVQHFKILQAARSNGQAIYEQTSEHSGSLADKCKRGRELTRLTPLT